MSRMAFVLLFCLSLGFAQEYEWVVPWTANEDGNWSSLVIINNHGNTAAPISLEAVRADGESQTVNGLTVAANSQLVLPAGETFDALGSGRGYCIYIKSPNTNLSASVSVSSLNTQSGDSPGLNGAVPINQTADRLIYRFMPDSSRGFAAPVIVNTSSADALVNIYAFNADGPYSNDPVQRTIAARRPFADLVTNLFPDMQGPSYLLVTSEAPLAGAGFSFNSRREPSMLDALPDSSYQEGDLDALLLTLETFSSLASGYYTGTTGNPVKHKRACPDITVNNPDTPGRTLEVILNWGAGCITPLGVFHAGIARVDLTLDGLNLETGTLAGTLAFDQFQSRRGGYEYTLDGGLNVVGSLQSFVFNGAWTAAAANDTHDLQAQLDSSLELYLTRNNNQFRVTGHLAASASGSEYGSVEANVRLSDPLVYNFSTCAFPSRGTLFFTIQNGVAVSGSLNFNTGDCRTATLTVAGQTSTITF